MKVNGILPFLALTITCFSPKNEENTIKKLSENPIFEGWYADPEGIVFGEEYWIYPTFSAAFPDQLDFDAFSSIDLVTWKKHERILDTAAIKWAKQAMWAPASIEKDGKYYLFFSANDVQRPSRQGWDPDNDINHSGGIGVGEEDQSFITEVPELAGCAADGATYSEALKNVELIIGEWIETATEMGRIIPKPKGKLMFA